MPKCRYCNSNITRTDTDICPYCGSLNPIPKDYKTMDVTKTIAKLGGKEDQLYKSKKRKTWILLCAFLGFAGAHEFYIGRKRIAIFEILLSAILIGGVGTIMMLLTPFKGFGYLFAFGVVYASYIGLAIGLSFRDSPRDGNGEFMR